MAESVADSEVRTTPSLFEQVDGHIGRDGYGMGKARNIFQIVNERLRIMNQGSVSRNKIQRILESVPDVFPEMWRSRPTRPGRPIHDAKGLSDAQRVVFAELQKEGKVSRPQIAMIIITATEFRDNSSPA